MWKLLDPRSTAASTSGTGRGVLRGAGRFSGDRAVAATGGTRAARRSGRRERRAAATGRDCIGIADDELRAFQAFSIVDLGAGQVLDAHGVDEQLDPEILDAGVAVLDGLIELEAVLQPRAAAALHENAQHQLRVTLAANEIAHLAGGRVGELERGSLLQRLGRVHAVHITK